MINSAVVAKKHNATTLVYKMSHASESDRARAIHQGHQLYNWTKPQWKIPLTQWKCPLSNKSIDMADRIGRGQHLDMLLTRVYTLFVLQKCEERRF